MLPIEKQKSITQNFFYNSHRLETVLKLLSLLLVLISVYLGVRPISYNLCLLVLLVACSYQFFRLYVYLIGSSVRAPFRRSHHLSEAKLPLISILVPCYNEGKVIIHCLESLQRINYPSLEIIVVDDGSSDNSYELVQNFVSKSTLTLSVFKQKNSGKSCALNFAIQKSRGEYVFCIDADCVVSPSSLLMGIDHLLSDQLVAAVAGAVHVANRQSFLTEYQELEYGLGDLQKTLLSQFGLVNVVPGPAGLFRKQAVLAVGGFDTTAKVYAEDTELTLRLIGAGYKILFEPQMTSKTEVPENLQALIRQRYRWSRGVYQGFRKNFYSLCNHHRFFAAYLFMEKVWTPILDFCVLVFFASQFVVNAQFAVFMLYSAVILITEVLQLFVVFALSKRKYGIFSFFVLLTSRFSLSVVVTSWRFISLFEEWEDVEMSWDKLQRVGLAQIEPVGEGVC